MARKLRKQRIALRFKRREQIKSHVRVALVRSVAVALIAGFGIGVAAGHDSVLAKFLKSHTPQVTVDLPPTLVGLPVLPELPQNHLWLWIPGSAVRAGHRMTRQYSAVRSVELERVFASNRVIVHVEPRIPLVIWKGLGFDRDGVLFNVAPNAWKNIPPANFSDSNSKAELGQWLARLSAVPALWSQVASIRQDMYGTLELTLKTGAVVIWGVLEKEGLSRKAQTLQRVLDDAHAHLGGTARADLRFFDQGRIIVRAKSAK